MNETGSHQATKAPGSVSVEGESSLGHDVSVPGVIQGRRGFSLEVGVLPSCTAWATKETAT